MYNNGEASSSKQLWRAKLMYSYRFAWNLDISSFRALLSNRDKTKRASAEHPEMKKKPEREKTHRRSYAACIFITWIFANVNLFSGRRQNRRRYSRTEQKKKINLPFPHHFNLLYAISIRWRQADRKCFFATSALHFPYLCSNPSHNGIVSVCVYVHKRSICMHSAFVSCLAPKTPVYAAASAAADDDAVAACVFAYLKRRNLLEYKHTLNIQIVFKLGGFGSLSLSVCGSVCLCALLCSSDAAIVSYAILGCLLFASHVHSHTITYTGHSGS